MDKFVVVIFGNEAAAYTGTRVFKDLDKEGILTLYGMAVIAKDANGKATIREAADQGPLGTAVGGLTGGLIGLLGGPAGVAIGAGTGALLGNLVDLSHLGVGTTFVSTVLQELTPGKAAVVAEVEEEWITPLDIRMEAMGGVVVRESRADFEYLQYQEEVTALHDELAELKAEYRQASQETRAKVKARIDQTQKKLENASARADARMDRRRKETEAKIKALQAGAAKASAEAKARNEKRAAEIRADYERRSSLMKKASVLVKEALKP
jgi:uncharacterized membrane protein